MKHFRLTLALLVFAAISDARADSYAAKTSAVIAEGWRHRVWALYPAEKVKADEALPTDRKTDAVRLSAAQGEHEPFLLVIRGDVPLRDVRMEFAALKQPGGATLAATNFVARRSAYIFVDEPSGTRIEQPMPFETGTGLFPDSLLHGGGVMRPGHNLQFWITVHVPRGTKPGRYDGALTLRFRKEGWMPDKTITSHQLPISIRVRDFALPERSPLLNTAFYNPSLLDRERREPEWLRGFQRDFIAHRQTPEPVLPSPVVRVDRDGTVTVDSAEWEKAAAFLLDEQKASHLFLPVWGFAPESARLQGVYFLWHFPVVTKQRWFGALIGTGERGLTPEFKQRFGAYLRHMHGVLKRRGWLGRVYLTTMDEPYTYHTAGVDRKADTPANNYAVIRSFVALVREIAPGLKTFCTADPTPELNGLIDHWCLRNLQHATAARERAARHGEIVTFCDNYRTFIDYPLVSARTLGWLAWKLGARGWLTYETMGGFATAWEAPVTVYPQFHGATVWGLGQMFYPEPTTTGIVPSLRWEMMREGCDDYEYLWLLRQKTEHASGSSTLVEKARELLDTAANEIVGGSGDPETSSAASRPNAQSNLMPHQLREKIADLIEQLGK